MQTTPVTQGQWKAVMGSNPSHFANCGDNCPVENISWNMAQEFIRKLNQREGTNKYRLPTEAQWEYAARAGSNTAYFFGDSSGNLSRYGWYRDNSGQKIHPVGQKPANAWGLHDVHGNVWEWVADWEGSHPSSAVTDPTGPASGNSRVLRGGSYYNDARLCRSDSRRGSAPHHRDSMSGFRVVLLPNH